MNTRTRKIMLAIIWIALGASTLLFLVTAQSPWLIGVAAWAGGVVTCLVVMELYNNFRPVPVEVTVTLPGYTKP